MTWMQRAAEVITAVIAKNPNATPCELRKLCSEAYPFGQRKNYPYTAWLHAMESAFGSSEQKLAAMSLKKEREDEATGQGRLL